MSSVDLLGSSGPGTVRGPGLQHHLPLVMGVGSPGKTVLPWARQRSSAEAVLEGRQPRDLTGQRTSSSWGVTPFTPAQGPVQPSQCSPHELPQLGTLPSPLHRGLQPSLCSPRELPQLGTPPSPLQRGRHSHHSVLMRPCPRLGSSS